MKKIRYQITENCYLDKEMKALFLPIFFLGVFGIG